MRVTGVMVKRVQYFYQRVLVGSQSKQWWLSWTFISQSNYMIDLFYILFFLVLNKLIHAIQINPLL